MGFVRSIRCDDFVSASAAGAVPCAFFTGLSKTTGKTAD